jgi:hypothetical protein
MDRKDSQAMSGGDIRGDNVSQNTKSKMGVDID